MQDFIESLNSYLIKEVLPNTKKVLEDPKNIFSQNLVNFFKKNNLNIADIFNKSNNGKANDFKDDISLEETIQDSFVNVNEDEYDDLIFKLQNIQNDMIEIERHLTNN